MVKSRFITARAAARHMIKQRSGVIILVTGSPGRGHMPGRTAIGAAFGNAADTGASSAQTYSPAGERSWVRPKIIA
jgi:NAD(P)-dependent dehydrogenase (short-subunit alcohol dehydrogenase family)